MPTAYSMSTSFELCISCHAITNLSFYNSIAYQGIKDFRVLAVNVFFFIKCLMIFKLRRWDSGARLPTGWWCPGNLLAMSLIQVSTKVATSWLGKDTGSGSGSTAKDEYNSKLLQ